MDFRYGQNIPLVLTLLLFIFPYLALSLRCRRCSWTECQMGQDITVECAPEHTDCATGILRRGVGTMRANSVLERYCYAASARNRLYRRNTPHCQKNDRGTVEVCVCQGDLCNAKLPPCRLRHYGNGQGCSRE